jgi:AcrR family transcriptional regulator
VDAQATQAEAGTRGLAKPRRKVIQHMGGDDRSSTRVRIVDAALGCLARQGSAKTTVDDIARASGFSRATLYRTFPGGKDDVLEAVVATEVARVFSALAVAMGEATDLEEVLVAGMSEAARRLSGHRALAYMLGHEPELILPHLTFAARWLEPDQASRAAEWAVRIVLAYVADPAPGTDLADPDDTRALVRAFVLPGILALRAPSETFVPTRCTDTTDSTDAIHATHSTDQATPPISKEAVQ